MQNKLKIVISATGFIEWTGGTEFLKTIIYLLTQKDFYLYLLLPSFSLKNYPKFLVKNFKSLLKIYNQIFPAKENPELKEIFKEFEEKVKIVYHNGNILKTINKIKPDIIYPTWDKLYNKCNIPQIAYLYDCQHKYYPEHFKKHSIKSRDKYFQTVVDNYKAIIVGSEDTKNDLIKFYNANPEHIFPINGYPTAKNSYFDDYEGDVLEKFNLPKNYFIVCSQFWKHKSHITAIEAVKILKDKGQEVCLVCTGKMEDYRYPEYIDELKEKIKEWQIEDNIKLLGMVAREDLLELIKQSTCLIQPSLYEGGAGAGSVFEALIYMKNIIMSDIQINKEYSHFENITYFESKNSQDLADKMLQVISLPTKTYTKEELMKIAKERNEFALEQVLKPVEYILK